MNNTNYVVVFYLGKRRSNAVTDKSLLIDKHLNYLSDNNIPLSRVTVVINTDKKEDVFTAGNRLAKFKDYYTELKVIIRPNVGHSYGGWSDAVNSCLEKGEKFKYYFLSEDDYLPGRTDFIDILASRMDIDTAYVCQKTTKWLGKPHAAGSNGLLSGDLAKRIYNRYKSALKIYPSILYCEAEDNQVHFLDNFTKSGFKIRDISDICSVPFLCEGADTKKYIQELGVEGAEPIMIPIRDV